MDNAPIIVSIISLVIALATLLFTMFQWAGTTKMKRAEIVNGLIGLLRTDKDIDHVLQMIDYDTFRYTGDFHDSDLESQVDRTFSFFSYICYMRKTKLLTPSEFGFFEYDLSRILNNRECRKYLFFIKRFSAENKATCPFKYLLEYGEEKGMKL